MRIPSRLKANQTSMSQSDRAREPSYLSTGQVAEILGITKKTLKNWLKSELIPEPERNPMNRYRRWTLNDIETIRRILSERNQRR
jgi:predicted site-specific integrase-resolvase